MCFSAEFIWSCYPLQQITIVKEVFQFVFTTFIDRVCLIVFSSQFDLHACLLLCSTVLQCKLRFCFLAFSFPEPVVSFGRVVRYKLTRVSLGTRNGFLVIQVLLVLIVTSGESTQLQAKQPGYPLQPVTELEILPYNLRILAMIGEINFDLLPCNAPLSVDPRQVFRFVQLKNNISLKCGVG